MITHRYTVKTDADSRSNRRRQTYIIEATSADEAIEEAVWRVYRMIRGDRSVWGRVVAIDGEPYVTMVEVCIGGQNVTCPVDEVSARMAAARATTS